MDSDEAPPPYSAVDPLTQSDNGRRDATPDLHRTVLRGGNASLPDASAGDSASAPAVVPFNSLSAAAYFTERPPTVADGGRSTVEHHLTIYPRSQSKDFPRRPRCWSSRADQITQQDWDVFLRYLFPPHLGPASASGHLPRQLRAEIQRDRKDRPQETDEQRKMRIEFVITEWNQCFFEPRAARIVFVYVTGPGNAPSSALCPRCYPAATRSNQGSRSSPVPAAGGHLQAPHSIVPYNGEQPAAAPAFAPGAYPYPNPPLPPFYPHPGMLPFPPGGFHDPRARLAAPHPPPNWPYCQWGWNNGPYGPPAPEFGGSKGGPLSWISQIASQAQKYGERITEQAQVYGDQISANAQYYGRQVEEHAMARGRWFEDQAGFGGRKAENLGDVFSGFVGGHGDQWTGNGHQQGYYANATSYPNPALNNGNIELRSIESPPPNPPPRRSSVDSASSDTSLTSINSLSTTSDLSSSDLATVRAQLLSLGDHHDRDLYDSAVGLRRQLDALLESRRQGHIPRRGCWRDRRFNHNPHNYGYHGGWGRWESPEQQQRNWAERRAVKEEMKATKKAFRDVLRRARDEQREKRRLKRSRRRQERRSRNNQREEPAQEVPLDQRLANLELESRPESGSRSQPENTSAGSTALRPRAQSESSSGVSEISRVSTPSTGSGEGAEASVQESTDKESRQGKGK
jgi:hypothetical protein